MNRIMSEINVWLSGRFKYLNKAQPNASGVEGGGGEAEGGRGAEGGGGRRTENEDGNEEKEASHAWRNSTFHSVVLHTLQG